MTIFVLPATKKTKARYPVFDPKKFDKSLGCPAVNASAELDTVIYLVEPVDYKDVSTQIASAAKGKSWIFTVNGGDLLEDLSAMLFDTQKCIQAKIAEAEDAAGQVENPVDDVGLLRLWRSIEEPMEDLKTMMNARFFSGRTGESFKPKAFNSREVNDVYEIIRLTSMD